MQGFAKGKIYKNIYEIDTNSYLYFIGRVWNMWKVCVECVISVEIKLFKLKPFFHFIRLLYQASDSSEVFME